MTDHKIRAGDLVRFPGPHTNDPRESMVVYADYATGWLAPACAGDSWEIQISAVELVTAATDEVHNGVLDRIARLISKGIELKAGARALEIYRPKGGRDDIERGVFIDLSMKAGEDAATAAILVAKLADASMSPGIILAAAQYLTMVAAAAFATSIKPRDEAASPVITDDRTLAVWSAIMAAWSLAPDAAAAELKLAEGLGALSPVEFIKTGRTDRSFGA